MRNFTDYSQFFLWADSKIIDQIRNISEDDFDRKLSNNVRSLKDLIIHIVAMYQYYFIHSEGITYETSLEEIKDYNKNQLLDHWLKKVTKFCKAVFQDEQKEFVLPVSRGKMIKLPGFDWIHLFSDHSSYHRGQIMLVIKQLGYDSLGTDYLKYQIFKNT